jgi:hypothetical protein
MTRPPFDLVEAEEELSGGYNLEYSSIDFVVLPGRVRGPGHQLGDHRHPVVRRPGRAAHRRSQHRAVVVHLKLLIILYIYVWIRATLPRLRYDQLMDLGLEAAHPALPGHADDRRRLPGQPGVGPESPSARRSARRAAVAGHRRQLQARRLLEAARHDAAEERRTIDLPRRAGD